MKVDFLTEKRLRSVLANMKSRCYNRKIPEYHRYGGRGIKICKEWRESASSFVAWAVQNGYQEGLTIDRINNDSGYEPDNCRWVTNKENVRNSSKIRFVEVDGMRGKLCELMEDTGLTELQISERLSVKSLQDDDIIVTSLSSRIVSIAEKARRKKFKKMQELKEILDANYCFFELL